MVEGRRDHTAAATELQQSIKSALLADEEVDMTEAFDDAISDALHI